MEHACGIFFARPGACVCHLSFNRTRDKCTTWKWNASNALLWTAHESDVHPAVCISATLFSLEACNLSCWDATHHPPEHGLNQHYNINMYIININRIETIVITAISGARDGERNTCNSRTIAFMVSCVRVSMRQTLSPF